MESKKRERSANFNNAETQLLVNLVGKFQNIVENKKTDAVTNKEKECAWKKIENSFNSCGISTGIRSWKTLKLKYEVLKKKQKKTSLQRQEMYRTGGGPSNAPELNAIEEKVLGICSNIKGLEARHDSDTISVPIPDEEVMLMQPEEIIISLDTGDPIQNIQLHDNLDQSFIEKEPTLMELQMNEENESQKENKWNRWHPKALKTRVSNVLKPDTATKSSVTNKLDKLSSARLELVQLQIDIAKKEHQLVVDENKLKMFHMNNDEWRKQEIHELLIKKLNCGTSVNINDASK